jgi:hypothetical protein
VSKIQEFIGALARGGYCQKNHIAIYCNILWDIAINIAIYCEF